MPKNTHHNHIPPEKPVFVTHEALPGASESKKNDSPLTMKKNKDKRAMEVLKEIYQIDGEREDMTKFEKGKRRPGAVVVGLIAFFAILALAAWAGFFIFKPYNNGNDKGVALAILGPDAPKAGETVEYDFTYKNTEHVPLAALEMRLVIPKEFHVTELPVPATSDPYTWTLGSITPGNDDRIVVHGYFIGPGEGGTAFQAIATYRPSNFNADFQAITTKQITFGGTVLEVATDGPKEASPGEEVTYSYKLKNTGTEKLAFEAHLAAPAHFLYASADPKPSDDKGTRWKLLPMDPGQETEIKLTGSFAGDVPGTAHVALAFGITRDDTFLVHREEGVDTNVLAAALDLGLLVNGSNENKTARFGDTLHTSLSFKNSSGVTLSDVVVSLVIASNPSGLVDVGSAVMGITGKRAGTVLTWTKKELPALATMVPNAEGTVDVSLPIAAHASGAGADEIRITGSALIGVVGGKRSSREVQTTPVVVTLNSDVALTAEARYFDVDGASMGSGPLPPAVGKATTLRVVWTLRNTRHDLDKVRVRTTLPSRVGWTSRIETGTGRLSWDPGSRAVTWTVPALARDKTTLTATFEVQITPDASDLGKFMTLTNETVVEAHDTKTDATISDRADSVTTDMQTDTGAAGKGIVIP